MSSEKKNLTLDALLWAWSEGMSADVGAAKSGDFTAEKNGLKIAFIAEPEKTRKELLSGIKATDCDLIYVVIDDNAKRRELAPLLPENCGILCFGNPFGLGNLYQVLKKPLLTAK